MTCHDARELFSALIDEALTREERADVYAHLTTCAECRRELTAMERTVALVRGASPVRAPAGFVDRVVAVARPVPWYVRVVRAVLLPWPVKLPLGAAAVLLVAGLAVLMFRGREEQQRATQYAPPALSDRAAPPPAAVPPAAPSVPTAPSEPATPSKPAAPPASAPEVTSGASRADSAQEADRAAAVASRVEQQAKREAPAEREAAPGSADTRAPVPEAREKTMAKRAMTQAQSPPAPDVLARLAAPDRDAAERAVAALAARLSGEVTGRRVEDETTVLDLVIPRERYGDFTREVARLGVFRVEAEALPSADRIRVAVRLGG